jgi:uncharacterized protein YbaR (Trm112 family)
MHRSQEWDKFVGCPRCKAALVKSDASLVCEICPEEFPIRDGVPILLTKERRNEIESFLLDAHAEKMQEEYSKEVGWRKRIRRLLAYGTNFGSRNLDAVSERVGPHGIILSVGGGPERERPSFVNLNIAPWKNVDLVGDAHELPCRSASVDAIVCLAVLEHLKAPWTAIEEFHRALKSGGIIYVEVPFLQHFHAYPHDFYRFTLFGLKELMKDFAEIQSGVALGPGAAMIEVADNYFSLLTPTCLSGVVKGLTRLFLLPVRALDRILVKQADAHTLANSVYFLGQRN